MSHVLHADVALARRYNNAMSKILADHVKALAKLRPQVGAGTMEVAGGQALYLGKGTPPGPNRVVGLGSNGPVAAQDLQEAEAFYMDRGLPCVVAITPLGDPSVARETAARGYVIGTFRNALACPIPTGVDYKVSTDVEVTLASSAEAETWAKVVGSGFAERELDAPPAARLATFHCPDTRCYLARIDGVEVGGGALTIAGGFAYIWDMSTRPDFRCRGVQLAIYAAMLRDAAKAGCDVAGLATEVAHGSQRNAERAGFRVIFTATAVVKQAGGGGRPEVV